MARKPQQPERRELTLDQIKAAIPKLQRRIAELEAFDVNRIQKRFDEPARAIVQKVDDTLAEIFGRDTNEYYRYRIADLDGLPMVIGGLGRRDYSLAEIRADTTNEIAKAVSKIQTLKETFEERVQDAVAEGKDTTTRPATSGPSSSRSVFIVHGHNNEIKEAAARLLTNLGLDPIILHEKPNEGRTIIEKFEAHSDVRYAIVICTPDDEGYSRSEPDKKELRARQNVIAELGFFVGKLGRKNLSVLFGPDVTLPSDFAGVAYHKIDDAGYWRLAVAKEMKAAGIDVDLNKV